MIPLRPTNLWFESLKTIMTTFYQKNKTQFISQLFRNKRHKEDCSTKFSLISLWSKSIQYIFKWIHRHQSDNIQWDIEQTFCNVTISDFKILSESIKQHPCLNPNYSGGNNLIPNNSPWILDSQGLAGAHVAHSCAQSPNYQYSDSLVEIPPGHKLYTRTM